MRSPAKARIASLYYSFQTSTEGSPNLLSNWHRGFSPRVKLQGHETGSWPPSRANAENVWHYTSTPKYAFMAWCLIKYREKLNLLFHVPTLALLLSLRTCGYGNVADVSEVLGASIFMWKVEKCTSATITALTICMRCKDGRASSWAINRRANLESTETSFTLYDRYDEHSLFFLSPHFHQLWGPPCPLCNGYRG
jgi:hypothetical protein